MKVSVYVLQHGQQAVFDVDRSGTSHSFLDEDGEMYSCGGFPWESAGKPEVKRELSSDRFRVPMHEMPVEPVKSGIDEAYFSEVVYIVSHDGKRMGVLARNKTGAS